MDNITQCEYERIMNEHDELIELIILRTEELANILYGRDPIGTCYETDFDINDNGTLLVQFEEYWHGESNMDSYHLPLEFLFSEDFREDYKRIIEKEKHDEEQLRSQKLIESKEKKLKEKEEYEREVYERLKKKYEDK